MFERGLENQRKCDFFPSKGFFSYFLCFYLFYLSHQQKERNPEKDLWRNSWGSNQSFVGKDDFWLALQSNYNYIMDTNLIDSCREARGELERNYSTETSHTDQKKVRCIANYILFIFPMMLCKFEKCVKNA